MTKYPNILTFDEFEDYDFNEWKIVIQFAHEWLDESTVVIENGDDRIEAVELIAEKINGVVYHQVDLESGERGYSRDRDTSIGIYVVVK